MNKTEGKLILALETGIDGGSVAILKDKKLLCFSEGTGSVSRSEDLLLLLEGLLEKNGLKKESIGLIAVSDSPGSATGIRIGLATAFGLGDSLAAKVVKCSILEAQTIVSGAGNQVVSALYSEKTGIYYRKFRQAEGNYIAETEILNEREPSGFLDMMMRENYRYILDKKLAKALDKIQTAEIVSKKSEIRVIEGSLAESLGNAVLLGASDND